MGKPEANRKPSSYVGRRKNFLGWLTTPSGLAVLLGLVLVLFVVWRLFLVEPAVEKIGNQGNDAISTTPGVDVNAVSLRLGSAFDDLAKSLDGVSDDAAAQAAMAKLAQLEKSLADLDWDALPAASKSALARILQPLAGNLKAAYGRSASNDTLKAALEPAYLSLMSHLEKMAQ